MSRRPAIFIVPGIFLLSILLFFPSRSRFQFDGDEGLFLMMGMLVDQGHALYDPIWSDQPPLFPLLLAGGFRFAGYRVGLARMIVAGFSALQMGTVYQILKERRGHLRSAVAVLLIYFSPMYLRLSVSVMNGLPAIALAMLALLLLEFWHQKQRDTWLVLSGIVLALSIGIKLLTAIVAPVMGLGLLAAGFLGSDRDTAWSARIRPALLWSVSLLVVLGVILFILVGPAHLPNLLDVHLSVNFTQAFDEAKFTYGYHIRTALPLLAAAVIGTVMAVRKRAWLMLYPAGWMFLGMVLLASISPVWDHHVLLVTVPAALPAAFAVVETASWLGKRAEALRPGAAGAVRGLGAALLVLAILAPNRPDALDLLTLSPGPGETGLLLNPDKQRVLHEMLAIADETQWILTDSPMMAFRARLPVPPEIAVFSNKRITAGALTEDDLLRILAEYQPEQVYLDRFELPVLRAALEEGYRIARAWPEDFVWFVREDL